MSLSRCFWFPLPFRNYALWKSAQVRWKVNLVCMHMWAANYCTGPRSAPSQGRRSYSWLARHYRSASLGLSSVKSRCMLTGWDRCAVGACVQLSARGNPAWKLSAFFSTALHGTWPHIQHFNQVPGTTCATNGLCKVHIASLGRKPGRGDWPLKGGGRIGALPS